MSRTRTSLVAATALLAGLAIGFTASVAADQPFMQSALDHLNAAERDLEKATADKGGHRVEALRLVRAAQAEVRQGIRHDRRN